MSQPRGTNKRMDDTTTKSTESTGLVHNNNNTVQQYQSRDPPNTVTSTEETLDRSSDHSIRPSNQHQHNPSFSHTHSHATTSLSGVSDDNTMQQHPSSFSPTRDSHDNVDSDNVASSTGVSLSHAYSHVRSINDYHATHNDQATRNEDGQPMLHTGDVITAKNTVQSYSILALPDGGSSLFDAAVSDTPPSFPTSSSWRHVTPISPATRGITTTTSADGVPLRQPRQPSSTVPSSSQQQQPSAEQNRSSSSASSSMGGGGDSTGGQNGRDTIHNEKTTLDSQRTSRSSGGAMDPDGAASVGLGHLRRSMNSSGMTTSSNGGTTAGAVIVPQTASSSSVVCPTIIEFGSPPIWATAQQDAVEAIGIPMSLGQIRHPLDTVTTTSALSSHPGMNASNNNMNTIYLHEAMTTSSERSAEPTNERKNSVIPILLVILIVVVLAGVVIAGVCVSGKCSDTTGSAAASSGMKNNSPAPVTSSAAPPGTTASLTTGNLPATNASMTNLTLNNSIAPVSAQMVNSNPTSTPATSNNGTESTNMTDSPTATTTTPIATSTPTEAPMSGIVASNETTTTNVPHVAPTTPPTTSAPTTGAPIHLTSIPTTSAPTLAPMTLPPTMATAPSRPTLAPLSLSPTNRPTTPAPVSSKPTHRPTTLRPTPHHTDAPISAKAARAAKITSYINNITLAGRTIQYNSATTTANLSIHERALKWLIETDPMQLVPDTQLQRFRMRQRYALRTMFVQQDSNNKWTDVSGWATGTDECTWFGILCNRQQVSGETGLRNTVIQISVSNNNVQGVLADDLGLLSSLNLFGASGSKLRGTLPSSLGRWTSMSYLDLNSNQLSGSIPAWVGNWKDLFTIYL